MNQPGLNALDAHARSLLALGKTELAKEVFAEALVMALGCLEDKQLPDNGLPGPKQL